MFPFIMPALKILSTYLVTNKVNSYVNEHTPMGSLKKSFVDNVLRDKVNPIKGSILHCSLFGAEHTGVYIGNNRIVELLGTGEIRVATPEMFIDGTNAMSIYVACNGVEPLGGEHIANRAEMMTRSRRNYHLLKDNCHQFTTGCITGEFENSSNFFASVEYSIKKNMNNGNSIEWRVWDI
ncbi:lecithin retinol acyltransferase family protein [Pseudaeromonas sharmana]|uniref:Lecithin retinol acyltransferase family protein n=1 Tax=Pseudaeromonas sharmana TaxID=328412 RepID=A0ABV8CL16_9GAMM